MKYIYLYFRARSWIFRGKK